MKTTDLQIRDFITFQKSIFSVNERTGEELGYVYVPEVGKVCALNDIGNVWVNDSEGQEYQITVDEIEPVPLTSEILEKNGFKEDSETKGIYWRPDCRKFCIVKELDTWYFAFRVLGETVDKSSGYICISECNYVHKLQHKLKDLEIEKEIVL